MFEQQIKKLYESTHTDGYHNIGDGHFYASQHLADKHAKERHGNHCSVSRLHYAVELQPGHFYILESLHPVHLYDTDEWKEDKKQKALEKLTEDEQQLLGLI